MLKLVEGFLNVCGYRDTTSTFVVFPIKGETIIEAASPVDGDIIQLLESLDEMVRSLFADIFDTKSPTTKEKNISLVACFQGEGVSVTGE